MQRNKPHLAVIRLEHGLDAIEIPGGDIGLAQLVPRLAVEPGDARLARTDPHVPVPVDKNLWLDKAVTAGAGDRLPTRLGTAGISGLIAGRGELWVEG